MDMEIDLQPIIDFLNLPTDEIILRLLILFGWIPIVFLIIWMGKELWLIRIRKQWASEQKFILLAIDIPRGNEQSPKAVENIFTYFAGAHATINIADKYWVGKVQLSFSFEIVSIEGYTQFLIRSPEQYRNLVESAVYSQYPDAEITEVNDYTDGFPKKFPDEEYDLWGTEWILKNKWVYPIKQYQEFEIQSAAKGEATFMDPMASLMDLCSSIGKGENLWFQIIVIPIGFDWTDEGDKEISKILGEKVKDTSFANKIVDVILDGITGLSEGVYSIWSDIESDSKDSKDDAMKMMNLKPKEKKQVEAINEKCSKLGFQVKMRTVYITKKELMNKPKAANGFVGYVKQFASLDLNNIKPDMDKTATSVGFIMQESRLRQRKNNIINNYMKRENTAGRKPYVFNIEELATLWHFPVDSFVKASMIQKAPGRKADAPMSLPVGEEIVSEQILEPIFEEVDKKRFKLESNDKFELNIKNQKKDTLILKSDLEQVIQAKTEKKGHAPSNLPTE